VVDFCAAMRRRQAPMAIAPFHTWAAADGTPWLLFYRVKNGYLLRFPDLADFEVSAVADDLVCFPAPGASEAAVEHLYLSQVRPLILSKRGKLVFHASCVEVAEGAIAFVAASCRGKSTLAASFASCGFRLLTDDDLLVEATACGFAIVPSHPSLRLWEDSREALMPPGVPTAPALDYTSKARILAGEEVVFCEQPRPLRRAYFLGDGSAKRIAFERLHPVDALLEWVKHSFLLDVEERPWLASQFERVAGLAKLPMHYRLDYPRKFEELAALRQAIVQHADRDTEAG
jgi:hypothetical protein